MCDVTGLAMAGGGALLQGASAAARSSGASKVAKARSRVMAEERGRQQALDQEAAGINNGSRERYRNFGGEQDARAQQLGDYFKGRADASAPPVDGSLLPQSGSNVVNLETAKQSDKARAFTDGQGEALGNLRAFGDLLGTKSREQARDAITIGQIGGYKQGLAALLPAELEVANGAGGKQNQLGDLLNVGSSFLINKGLQGSFIGPASPSTAANVSNIASGGLTLANPFSALPSFLSSPYKVN